MNVRTEPEQKVSRSKEALVWVGGLQLLKFLFSFGIAVLMARWMGPAAYGLFALASLWPILLQSLEAFGLDYALIQADTLDQATLSSAWWFMWGTALLFMGFCQILVFPMVYWTNEPALIAPFLVLSPIFLPAAACSIPRILLHRAMRFRQISQIEFLSNLSAGLAGLMAAGLGWGLWSLVLMQWVRTVFRFIGYRFSWVWKADRTFSWRHLAPFRKFCMGAFPNELLSGLHQQFGLWFIGGYLPPSNVGLFRLAYNTTTITGSIFQEVFSQVFLPSFSRHQAKPQIAQDIYFKVLYLLAIVTTPLALAYLIWGDLLIHFLYATAWLKAVPYLHAMAFLAVFHPFLSLVQVTLYAFNLPHKAFQMNVLRVLWFILVTLSVFHPDHPSLIAWTLVLSYPLAWGFGQRKVGEFLKIPLTKSIFWFGIFFGLQFMLAYLCRYATDLLVPHAFIFIRLVLSGFIFLFLYGLTLWTFQKPRIKALLALFNPSV